MLDLLMMVAAPALSPNCVVDLESCTILATQTLAQIEAPAEALDPSALFSFPFPFESQTPLAIRVDCEPAGRIAGMSVVAERENRFLRVQFHPMQAGDAARITLNTFVMVREREQADGRGTKLCPRDKIPADVAEHLRPAPGVDCDLSEIAELASSFSRKDLRALVDDVLGYIQNHIKAGAGGQGAREVLQRKSAACTGCANLGASLLIAAGVPTRILACLLVNPHQPKQQEHYIVETWTKDLGWTRVETTLKIAVPPDAQHAIMRIVYPDSPRNAGMCPWFDIRGVGLDCRNATYEGTQAMQSAMVFKTGTLPSKELDAIEAAARKSFENLLNEATPGPSVQLVSTKEAPRGITKRGRDFLLELEQKLAGN